MISGILFPAGFLFKGDYFASFSKGRFRFRLTRTSAKHNGPSEYRLLRCCMYFTQTNRTDIYLDIYLPVIAFLCNEVLEHGKCNLFSG